MDDRERQLEQEGAQRQRVALLAIAAGILYLVGEFGAWLASSKTPTVGLLQGLSPALHGLRAAHVDPRTDVIRFLDKHAVDNVLFALVSAAGLIAMRWPLRYLLNAAVARDNRPAPITLGLASFAPPLIGLGGLVETVSLQTGAHGYLTHSARTAAAVTAATAGSFRLSLLLAVFVLTVCTAFVFIMVGRRAMNAGLLTKVMGWLGVACGFLFIIQIVQVPLLQFAFLVGIGMTLLQLGGLTRPPAWETGEAIPWVSQAQLRAQARGPRAPREPRARRTTTTPTPAPTVPASASFGSSRKRKRRR